MIKLQVEKSGKAFMSLQNHNIKITMQQFDEFEKYFLMDVLKNPDYRLGQAFINTFWDISNSIEQDGDMGVSTAIKLWEAKSRDEVLTLIDWYIEDV